MSVAKTNDTKKYVLRVIRKFLIGSDNRPAVKLLKLDASIEDDLGVDSIGRAEILRLLEKEFSITISDQRLLEAESVEDIVSIVNAAKHIKESEKKKVSRGKEAFVLPKRAHTLLQVLEHYVQLDDKRVHLYLQQEDKEHKITYADLYKKAKYVAQGLIGLGVVKGDTIAIMLPTCEAFFYAFFGILYAGAIPIPIYPPVRAKDIEHYVKNEKKILNNAEVRVLITFEKGKSVGQIIKRFIPTLRKVTTVKHLMESHQKIPRISVSANDPALIQYTSGSTGNPKGVLLQHRNLLTNLRSIGEKININENDVIVSWLPLYHDMGLIGAWLGSLYYGIPLVLHSPLAFLTRPERWLWSIDRYKGTISASPNFGYEFCTHKVSEDNIAGLDLSSWRLALNGAEAISADTIRHFVEKFSAYRFDPKAIYPVYGLAESTVALSFPDLNSNVNTEKLDREIFLKEKRAEVIDEKTQDFFEFVSCGKPLAGHDMRIVDDAGNALEERHIGRVQFRGPSAMQGYYNNRQAVEMAYHDGWWDTGDMGYMANDEFFPTGRRKDLIIKAGRNFYPEDIEQVVDQLPFIRKGAVVAFGLREEESGTEKIIVVAEIKEKKQKKRDKFIANIRHKIKEAIGIPPDQVVLVQRDTIPKTSSGKLQRSATKMRYLNKELKPFDRPVWIQLSKLLFQGLGQTISYWLKRFLRFMYTIHVSLVVVTLLTPLWIFIFVLPQRINRYLAKYLSRIVLLLSACPLIVNGRQHVKKSKQYIFVSNHTSFADTLVLLAILPAGTLFLAKKELMKVPFLRSFIKRLGHLVTTREDFRKGEQEMQQVNEMLSQHRSLVIYPEGTFTYARGVRRFKLGAFTLAAESGIPVCPIALKGVRDILRGEEWLLCPGKVTVTFEKPINPHEEEDGLITKIRDKARSSIAKCSGEEAL